VLKAIADLRREDRRISRRVVVARAGVHRNFLQRHKDLATLIDEAAGGQRPDHHLRPEDRITRDSLLVELATANQRNRPSICPALLDQQPVVIDRRKRLAEVELDVVEKDRTITSLQEDIEVLRETNRSLVREYGLASG
jgi:hypothetical protein